MQHLSIRSFNRPTSESSRLWKTWWIPSGGTRNRSDQMDRSNFILSSSPVRLFSNFISSYEIYAFYFFLKGKEASVKLDELVSNDQLRVKDAHGYFLSSLDEIAWLLNLRCTGDVSHLPVFYSYLSVPFIASPLSCKQTKVETIYRSDTDGSLSHPTPHAPSSSSLPRSLIK